LGAGIGQVFLRLVRSGVAGAAASVTDLASLALLVGVAHVSARAASVPCLLAGNVVMFFGQKLVAFRARGTNMRRELLLFALVQAGGLVLTAVFYDGVMRLVPERHGLFLVARIVTTNVVWLAYSFPMWHFVFQRPPQPS
jgi:putative flippase GtrA